jgi:hypothetical protein
LTDSLVIVTAVAPVRREAAGTYDPGIPQVAGSYTIAEGETVIGTVCPIYQNSSEANLARAIAGPVT